MSEINAVSFHDSTAENFSHKYETSPDFIERKNVWTRLLKKYVKLGGHILDAGCGNGIFSFMAARLGGKALGVDGSQSLINLCNKDKADLQGFDINFKCALLPANSILTEEKHFDLIISSSVLEYIEDVDQVMQMFKRVSKENGVVIISFPNRDCLYRKAEKILFKLIKQPYYYTFVHNTWTLDQFEEYSKKFGFNLIESEYYGGPNLFNKMIAWMGDKLSKNLCVVVLRNNN